MSSSSESSSDELPPEATLSNQHDDSSDSSSEEASSSAEDDHALPEAQVLSHADKRRQKKKGKESASTDPAHETRPAKSTDKSNANSNKRQNSVWVGNLAFKTTPDSLRRFFDGVGEITRIHMPMKLSTRTDARDSNRGPLKENRGFAYVDFATPDSKLVAISLSENPLDGRRLLIKDGDDFNGRPAPAASSSAATSALDQNGAATSNSALAGHSKTAQKILRAQKQPPGPTLFLGNLGFEATEQSIRDLLESHRVRVRQVADDNNEEGANEDAAASDKWIRKIRMGTFEDSGKCKGWAFVDFTTTEHATAALTNPKNHHLDGRNLVVEYASPDAVRRGGHRPATGKKPGPREYGGSQEYKRSGAPPRKRPYDGGARGTAAHNEEEEGDGEAEGVDDEGEGRPAKKSRVATEARGKTTKGPRTRPKPGAALALAKREEVAIVPSQGRKIVF